MSNPHSPRPNQRPHTPIPPLQASALLEHLMTDRNPLQALLAQLMHTIQVLKNVGKARKMARQRIQQLEGQFHAIESQISQQNDKNVGNRLDKMR